VAVSKARYHRDVNSRSRIHRLLQWLPSSKIAAAAPARYSRQRLITAPDQLPQSGALRHITTGIIKARTKHINVCYHNSRDLNAHKIVDYFYVHTNENVADILIKALTKDQREKFTKAMGLW